MSAVARLRPEQALEAAGYIRVSLERQAEGYSPDVQRDAIRKLAAEQGYALTMIEEDHERGSNVSRIGYQRIIEAVRAGTIHAVIVFMFDRWGRDGAEWITRAREFERLHVPIISVQEGRDEGGLMRFMRAGMAEEYSRQLAKRVRPSRERGARAGVHQGPTPYGYRRVYPAHEGTGRRPPGQLLPDEATAWVVRELYSRYASGGWSLRSLALWLNTDVCCGPAPHGRAWTTKAISWILRSPVYKGAVRHNHVPQGIYDRAGPEDMFTADGRHEALVTPEQWAVVQARIDAARKCQTYNLTRTPSGRPLTLASGLLRCAVCGGSMGFHLRDPDRHNIRHGEYLCLGRTLGKVAHAVASFKADLAHSALLAEVRRLRGAPWTLQAEHRLLGTEGTAAAEAVGGMTRALEQERERLRRHTRLMTALEEDPTPEQIATFREVSAEISARIRALEAQLKTTEARAVAVPDLKRLHKHLTHTEIADALDALNAREDREGLRSLVLELAATARLVERRPDRRPVWARVEVTWTPDVQTLLDAGLLWLDDPVVPPYISSSAELLEARQQRSRAKMRAQREARRIGTLV